MSEWTRVCPTCQGSGRVAVPESQSEHICLACGRQFNGSSRPRWAVDLDYRVLGQVHASCAARYERDYPGADTVNLEGEVASDPRWIVWIMRQTTGELSSDTYFARSLAWHAYGPVEALNRDQEDRIQYWITGGLGLDPELVEPIKEAYRRLVRGYLETVKP